jgi:hypothetical protein
MQLRLLFLRARVGLHSRVDLPGRNDRPFATDRGSERASANHGTTTHRAAAIIRFSAPTSSHRCRHSTAAATPADLSAASANRAAGSSAANRSTDSTAASHSGESGTGHSGAAERTARSSSPRLELGTQNGAAGSAATELAARLRSLSVRQVSKIKRRDIHRVRRSTSP